jgi:PKD repeat protein
MRQQLFYRTFFLLALLIWGGSGLAQAPSAAFTQGITTGCAPLTVSFTNGSSNAASYTWSFGDGNTSVLTHPVNVYSQPGTYTVKLVATSSSGQQDSVVAVNLITVALSPIADFYPLTTSSCLDGNSFSFVNTSSGGNTWLWDLGDGNTSTLQNPVHSYTSPGYYTVKLIATNANGCSDLKTITQCVQVYPKPAAAISSSFTTACSASQPFQFTTSSASSYLWSFGDNTTSSQQNPSHTYSSAGNYNVSLIVGNAQGCSDTLTQNNYITIYPQQTPAFSANDSMGCPAFQVNFTDLSPGAASWLWDFGDNTSSTLQNPSHTYNNTGSYDVSLTITAANGCTYTGTANNFISVQSNPVASFTASNTSGCAPLTAQFNNQSSNSTSWYWEFGDNYYSTQQHPSHSYGGNTSYTVKLHAYNNIGCEAIYQASNIITSYDASADFSAANTSGCAPFTAAFTSVSANAASYYWSFGDGSHSTQANPSHIYNVPGLYTVSLVVVNNMGCTDTVVKQSYIDVINTAAGYVAPPTVQACAPFSASFSNSTPGATGWLWDFGDGFTSTQQNPTHTYTGQGFFTVSLIVQTATGCTQFYNQFRTYNIDRIDPGFTFTQGQCAPYTVTFNDTTSNAASWLWNFGDNTTSASQNPVHNYPGPGLYTVSLTVTTQSGCSSTIIGSQAIDFAGCGSGSNGPQGGPVGSSLTLPPITGCVPLAITFNNLLPGTSSWMWDFGDNSTSSQQDPYHVYTTPGNYTISMIGYYPSGASDTIVYNNYVTANGTIADFTVLPPVNCQANVIALNDNSVNATSWTWDFGDNTTSVQQNPTHTYTNANDNYSIVLLASGPGGCSSMTSKTIFSSTGIAIWANKYDACFNSPINFFCGSAFSSYYWDFGDNTSSNQQNPTHTYTTGGNYTVTLTATDSYGCPHTFTMGSTVIVRQPVADFTSALTGSCNALAMQFTNLSTGANNYRWTYGDNSQQWAMNPAHTYSSPAVYNVTLEAYYSLTCVTSVTKPVAVLPTQAGFTFTQQSLCLPVTVAYTDTSTNAVSWLWNFGNGQTSTAQHPTYTFTSMPSGPVTLTITDSRGCTSTISKPNIRLFNASFTASDSSGCGPLAVSFTDSSLAATAWHWDFGDGNTSSAQNPIHVYSNNGSYTATLIATASAGCSDTVSFGPIDVYKPTAAFISPTAANCAPSLVSFTDQSLSASSWYWNFGDGSYSASANPSHIYNQPGLYTITLITGSPMGCYDTLVRTNYIQVLGPTAGFNVSSSSICYGSSMQFTNTSAGASSWSWNFGDGNTSSLQDPAHLYQNAGQFSVSLIVHDTLGCTASYSLPVPVQVNALPSASFALSDTSACAPASISFIDQSQGAAAWAWSFGDGGFSAQQSPSHTYPNTGAYTVSLAITSQQGCSDTVSFNSVIINPAPLANFSAPVQEGCSPLQVSFIDASVSSTALTYSWNLGNNTSSQQSPQSVYYSPGPYNVSLTVTNTFGCSDTMIKPAFVNVLDTVAPGASPILSATVVSDTSTYISWTPCTASDFAYYAIYRLNAQTGTYQQIATVSNIAVTNYTDTGLNTLHNSYCYKIQTIDKCGYAIPLSDLSAHCTMDITASAQANGINVSWTPYIGASVASYNVYRMEPGDPNAVLIATVAGSVQSIVDPSALCPVPFCYRVKATGLNNLSLSSSSDTSVAIPAINYLSGQKVDVVRSTVIENSSILTEWKAPAVAPQTVTAYNIYRSENQQQFTLIATLPAQAFSYIDNNVDVNSRNYFYKVEIVNVCNVQVQAGNAGSSILLTASAEENGATLSWTPYEGWDMGVDHYVVEKQNGQGEWEVIKIVGGSTTRLEDN